MPAYLIAEHIITDKAKFEEYRTKAAPMIAKRSLSEDDPLEDFDSRSITLDGVTKVVYVAGAGPAVIVMTEMRRWMSAWPESSSNKGPIKGRVPTDHAIK